MEFLLYPGPGPDDFFIFLKKICSQSWVPGHVLNLVGLRQYDCTVGIPRVLNLVRLCIYGRNTMYPRARPRPGRCGGPAGRLSRWAGQPDRATFGSLTAYVGAKASTAGPGTHCCAPSRPCAEAGHCTALPRRTAWSSAQVIVGPQVRGHGDHAP